MAGYVNCLYTSQNWRTVIGSIQHQVNEMLKANSAVRRLEHKADLACLGYDPWPIDDDANAAQQAVMKQNWENILAAVVAASTLAPFRYKYVIKSGRPAAFATATVNWVDIGAGTATIAANAGNPFSKVIGHATQGDRFTLRWTNSNGLVRSITGLFAAATTTGNEIVCTAAITSTAKLANGSFGTDPDTDWTWGANWSLVAGKAVATAAATALSQALTGLVVGAVYRLVYTVSDYAAGTLRPSLAGAATVNATDVAADGTYTFNFIADQTTATLSFAKADATALTLKLDSIAFTEVQPVADDSVEVELEAPT
jgi:hypothetical protein